MSLQQVHYRACHLCEAICGLEIKTEGDTVVSIKGDKDDPFSQGYICPKATAIADIHSDPARLRQPMQRNGDDWQPISWEAAYDSVSKKLVAIQKKHGVNSVGVYLGNPCVHNWGMMTHITHLLKPLKTRNRFSATSVDQLPHQLMCYWMYGHKDLVPVPDIDHTDYLMIIGGNPMASNGSLWTVPGFRKRVKTLHSRGGKLIVIDPRRTETAEVADQHAFIRPGTDAFLLLALIQEIAYQGWVNTEHLADHLDEIDKALEVTQSFTVAMASQQTGIAESVITQWAYELAHTKKAVVYGRMGISVQRFGTVCQWAIQLLNLITGHLDTPGGSTFSTPAVDTVMGVGSRPGHFNVWQSRVRALPEFNGELPCAALAEEILTPGKGQIRAMVTGAGNPALSTPNGHQLEQALSGLDFMVSIDFYINETTRFADVILPPTGPLHHDHYDLIFNGLATRNVARYNPALFTKPENSQHDWEILSELGKRISTLSGNPALPEVTPTMLLDIGLKSGPYGESLSFSELKGHPHGLDLGAHYSQLPQRLCHQSKRIQCAPPEVLEDLSRLLQSQQSDEASIKQINGFYLIGRRHVRSNNSWMHNYTRLVKGKGRCQLLMHPSDAENLSLQVGQQVLIRSRIGEVQAELSVTDSIREGVVSLPHGWGHHRQGVRTPVATNHAEVSANDVTDDQVLDVPSGNAVLNGVPVQIVGI